MAKVPSRILVIDSSIAAASGETSKHPTAEICREFLDTVLRICHRVVLTPPVRDEWNRHQSRFARKWRLAMMKRGKVEIVQVAAHHSIDEQIENARLDASVTAIIDKDRHLIEAALATDKRIASLDDRVRNHLRANAATLPMVQPICWVNPNVASELPIVWLEAGAPAEKSRMLG